MRSRHDRAVGNLAPQLTSFVGRERDIPELGKLVSERCLLTLTGPGGCGKTRLALAVASEVASAFEDGVWLVELSSVSEPGLVSRSVASVLLVPEAHGIPVHETLVEHLEARNVLLVLDNCEHLSGACADLVDTLLRACPSVRVLATSREVLGVPGEVAWPVPPLSLPEVPDLPAEKLRRYEAIRLFVERARA
ncbi:MAG TPA: AAA family ATPase, partial [Rubrobacter sp.]|nr:AAA family ATPase [Rubrobacter sp.]